MKASSCATLWSCRGTQCPRPRSRGAGSSDLGSPPSHPTASTRRHKPAMSRMFLWSNRPRCSGHARIGNMVGYAFAAQYPQRVTRFDAAPKLIPPATPTLVSGLRSDDATQVAICIGAGQSPTLDQPTLLSGPQERRGAALHDRRAREPRSAPAARRAASRRPPAPAWQAECGSARPASSSREGSSPQ